jgi:hypothetical protein
MSATQETRPDADEGPQTLPRYDLQVPTDRSDAAVAAHVERVLGALAGGGLVAEIRVTNEWGVIRVRYRRTPTGPTAFEKRVHDRRCGRVAGSIPRAGVRAELQGYLTGELPENGPTGGAPTGSSSRFRVRPDGRDGP